MENRTTTENTTTYTFSNEGVLPVFKGFYGGIFDIQAIEERLNEILVDEEHPDEIDLSGDTLKNFEQLIGEKSTEIVQRELNKFLNKTEFKFTFEKIWSPKEYNFVNDHFEILIEFNKNDLDKLFEYVNKNITQFEKYVKDNFTSYSGFMSFHSNDVQVWFDEYIPTILTDEKSPYLSYLLEFVCQNENYTDESLYYEIEIVDIAVEVI